MGKYCNMVHDKNKHKESNKKHVHKRKKDSCYHNDIIIGVTGPIGPTGPITPFQLNIQSATTPTGPITSGPISITTGDSIVFVSNSLDITVSQGSAIVEIELLDNLGLTGPTGPIGPTGNIGTTGPTGPITPLLNPEELILNVYISTSGSNTNDGLTDATPIESLSRAIEVIQQHGYNEGVIINFLPSLTNYVLPISQQYTFKNMPLGKINNTYVLKGTTPEIIDTLTVSSSSIFVPSNQTIITVTTTITPELYKGLSIQILTGTTSGNYHQISNNDANNIYLLDNLTLDFGDTFNVLKNVTTMEVTGNNFIDGKIIINDIDILLNDAILPLKYSFQSINQYIIFDNVRFITNNTLDANILFQNSNILSSLNTTIINNNYNSKNLGLICDSLTNASLIKVNFINSYCNFDKIYLNRINFNVEAGKSIIYQIYFNKCTNATFNISSVNFENIVVNNCGNGSNSKFFALDNNSSLKITNLKWVDGNSTSFSCNMSNCSIDTGDFDKLLGLIDSNNNSKFIIKNCTITNLSLDSTLKNTDSIFDSVIITSSSNTNPNITFLGGTSNFNDFAVNNSIKLNVTNTTIFNNNLSCYSTNGITITNCVLQSNGIIINGVTNTIPINIISSVINENDTWTISNSSDIFDSIIIKNSNLNFTNGINLINVRGMNIDMTTININQLSMLSMIQYSVHTCSQSFIKIKNIMTETENVWWNIDQTQLDIEGINHDGILSNSYIRAIRKSYIRLNKCNMNSIQTPLIELSESSVNMDDCTIDNAAFVILATGAYDKIYISNCRFGVASPIINSILYLNGGSVTIYGSIGHSSDTYYSLYMLQTIAQISSSSFVNTVTSGGDCIRAENASIICLDNVNITNNNINNGRGIHVMNSTFDFQNMTINDFREGIVISKMSKGFIANVNGANLDYGIRLTSGSNFSNQRDNGLSGTIADVVVGSAGGKSWSQVNSGLQADTTDYPPLYNPSEYVYISYI